MSVDIRCDDCGKKWRLRTPTEHAKCPICSQESFFSLEAESLAEAETYLPAAMRVVRKAVLSEGASKTARACGDTIAIARERARQALPRKAEIRDEKTTPASSRQVQAAAFSEVEVRTGSGRPSLAAGETIASIDIVERARKGLFGLGRRPNMYNVTINKAACVHLEYATKAKVSLLVQRIPATLDELCADLSALRARLAKTAARVQKKSPERPPNAVEALIVIDGLFHLLEEWVSSDLAFLLDQAKRYLPDNASVQQLSLPKVVRPETISAVDTEMAEATRSFLSQCSQSLRSIDVLLAAASATA